MSLLHRNQEYSDVSMFIYGVIVAGVRVTAVDKYQGEENGVIILSLVHSNQEYYDVSV